jgi:hypothetical protein
MGFRGPKPKSTHLKLITGNPGKRAINRNEPQTPSLRRTAPRGFDPEERAIWREYLREWPDGLLREHDRKMLELAVYLTKALRHPPVMGCVLPRLQSVLETLGGSPAARTRVAAPGKADGNPFEEL